jgi:hypothetical protein
MFFFLSTEMLFKAITKQSSLWDRLFWRSSCGRSTTCNASNAYVKFDELRLCLVKQYTPML